MEKKEEYVERMKESFGRDKIYWVEGMVELLQQKKLNLEVRTSNFILLKKHMK